MTAKIRFFDLNFPKIVIRLGYEPRKNCFFAIDVPVDIDYQRLFRIQQAGGFFVIRAKENMAFDRVYSHCVHKELGIQVDQTIKFTDQQSQIKYPGHLRRIKFHNQEKDKTFIFLTNHFDIDATTIAGLYKERWKIELFFRWIKQHLKIKSFYGTSENAIHCQIWSAICTYLLVAIAKKKLKIGQSLYSFLQVISISIFEKEPVNQLVSNSTSHFKDSDFSNQLILF